MAQAIKLGSPHCRDIILGKPDRSLPKPAPLYTEAQSLSLIAIVFSRVVRGRVANIDIEGAGAA